MDSIGCPIIGDTTYGDFSNLPARLREAAKRLGRQALHAASLSFTHPISGERLSFSAALPEDLATLIAEFRAVS
jgi:23S rRNA pseudouridine1911/1915/1917 synthase